MIWYIIGAILIGLPIILIVVKRHEILSFLHPEDYCLVTMLETDNNVRTWLQRKTKDLRFTFNEAYYNLFFPSVNKNEEGVPMFEKAPAIYRNGRLSQFFYAEGESSPFDYRQIEVSHDNKLEYSLSKVTITNLWKSDDFDLFEIIKNNIPAILIGLVILFAVLNQGGST